MKHHGRRIMVQHAPGPVELPPQWGVSTAGPRTNANGPWEPGTPAPWTHPPQQRCNLAPSESPPPRLLPHRTRRPPTQKHDPPKYSAASEVPGSRGERGFISSSEPLAAPHAPRPIPKVALIMYSQAAIISTRDQRWPCHGKQKATLRLTRAVSICEVYIKKTQNKAHKTETNAFRSMFWFPFPFPMPTRKLSHKLSHMHPH